MITRFEFLKKKHSEVVPCMMKKNYYEIKNKFFKFSLFSHFILFLTIVDVCFPYHLSTLVFPCILFDAFDNFYTISCTLLYMYGSKFYIVDFNLDDFFKKIQKKKITYFMVEFGVTTFFTIRHCFIAILWHFCVLHLYRLV